MRIKNKCGLTITRTVTYAGRQYTFPTFKLERGEVLNSAAKCDADEVQWAVRELLVAIDQGLAQVVSATGALLDDPKQHLSTFPWVLPLASKIAIEIRQLSQGRRVIDGIVSSGRTVGSLAEARQ